MELILLSPIYRSGILLKGIEWPSTVLSKNVCFLYLTPAFIVHLLICVKKCILLTYCQNLNHTGHWKSTDPLSVSILVIFNFFSNPARCCPCIINQGELTNSFRSTSTFKCATQSIPFPVHIPFDVSKLLCLSKLNDKTISSGIDQNLETEEQ